MSDKAKQKLKVLLMGKGKIVIDDFFSHLTEEWILFTCSGRCEDIVNHLKYSKPDVAIYCIQEELEEVLESLSAVKEAFLLYDVPLIIVGNQWECEAFQKSTGKMAELVLKKPVTARNIKDKVLEFLEKRKPAIRKTAESSDLFQIAIEEKAAKSKGIQAYGMNVLDVVTVPEEMPVEEQKKKHILVVDDDPMMLRLIRDQLKDTYAVGTALSGKIALQYLESRGTDLILLDYEMPTESGAEVLEKIRNNEETAKTPVIFLTGISETSKIKKVLDLKPQGYLLKPVEKADLLQSIERVIG